MEYENVPHLQAKTPGRGSKESSYLLIQVDACYQILYSTHYDFAMRLKKYLLVCFLITLVSCGGIFGSSSSSGVTDNDLVAARSNFQNTVGTVGKGTLNGGVGVSGGSIFGVSADPENGTISVWNLVENTFTKVNELLLLDEWCGSPCTWGIDSIKIVDLTGEGNDDIYVDYHLNDPEGQVFSQVSGSWISLKFDLGLHASSVSGSSITAYHEPCLPSCADGGAIPIFYSWDGSEFKSFAVDDFGNQFFLNSSPKCSSFTVTEFEPYKLCDRGDGIRYFQQVLYEYGLLYYSTGNPVDGYFGPDTEYSIKVYQFRNHIPVDGIVEGQWYHDLIENYNGLNGYGE